MIVPCRRCGGKGWLGEIIDSPTPGDMRGCPRCEEMPKLTAKDIQMPWRRHELWTHDAWHGAFGRGWFKPDPDSVIRWCKGLERVIEPHAIKQHESYCIGPHQWQPRPTDDTALEEVDDE